MTYNFSDPGLAASGSSEGITRTGEGSTAGRGKPSLDTTSRPKMPRPGSAASKVAEELSLSPLVRLPEQR